MSERPLRILHVLNTVRETGNGIINTAMDLVWGQAQRGHSVSVASQGGEYESRLAEWGVVHHRIDQSRRAATLWRAAWAMRALLRETNPDVVHAHMVTGTLLVRMVRDGRPPLLVAHVHNVYQRSARWMRRADVVLCCGASVRETMRAQGVPDAKLRVVLNGTVGSPRLRNAEQVAPAPIAKPAIVTVAGMNARKGIDELIAAFARLADRHPSAQLHLVGDGPERSRLEAVAAATSCAARIRFHGFQRDPMPFLRAADVFVLASRRESSPIVIGEARAAGCAIVATAVDGVPETLDEGRAGTLVPPQDVPALAEALHRLLSDPARRTAQSAAARQGLERFHVTRMVDETLALYRAFAT